MIKRELLDLLVCPLCQQKVKYDVTKNELICEKDKLAYPIEDDIPVMLEQSATKIA